MSIITVHAFFFIPANPGPRCHSYPASTIHLRDRETFWCDWVVGDDRDHEEAGARPQAKGFMYYELTDHFIVSADLQTTWDFFSTADNLPAITPPWLRFRIDTPMPVVLGRDSVLDYTIRWMGIPVRWRTRLIDWSPPRQFIDLQIRGPYALWHHQHTFADVAGGVECRDRVVYRVPGRAAGRALHTLMIRRQLLEIFQYRRSVVMQRLGWVRAVQPDIEIRRL